ncbi:hypothetical protein Zmor_017803 [Zophobas morio]|uniref:ODAD1 central coiled coil region domain-containing protein n=1 Tax=Zophobas morio TaxID=2755281 RepID=A0AA38MD48_9CUCU|nr:hypothetical protein Zmor_017803 [Zophobas morio]
MQKVRISDEEKQFQTQLALERELRTLIREYFVLDRGSNLSRFSKNSTLARQTNVISIFKHEHANILRDLIRAKAPGRKREDEKLFDELSGLIEEYHWYDNEVKRSKVYIEELNIEIKLVQKGVQLLRKQQITDRQHEDRFWQAVKTVETLENKLEAQMIQFGTICTKNKQLREEIDGLLNERNVFMTQWERLIDKLIEGKKIMLDLIEQATIAYNQREDWCTKLQILRYKALHDLNTNSQEMRENARKYDHNLKLKEFFDIKGQKRVMRDLEIKERRRWEIIEEKLKNKLELYKNMLDDIKGFTKTQNIKKIASTFAAEEELNLSKFKYILYMIKETEEIGERLGFLHLDIQEKNILHTTRELQQQGTLEQLHYDLEDATRIADKAEKKMNETQAVFDELLKGTFSLFKICKCNEDPLIQLLGNNTQVQFYNVELYLNILERTIHELLVIAGYKDSLRKPDDPKKLIVFEPYPSEIYPIEKVIKATPCSLCVEHEMVSDVIDTLQRIYSLPEARDRLKRRLKLPGGKARLHTISHCQLPKSRRLMQRRYE